MQFDVGEVVRVFVADVYKQQEVALRELVGPDEGDMTKYSIWECISIAGVEDREEWARLCFVHQPGYTFVGWLPGFYAWRPIMLVKEQSNVCSNS